MFGTLNSRAVQNPSISLDMDPSGNIYTPSADVNEDGFPDPGTNHMTIGSIDTCLTTAPGNAVTHNHIVDLIIQNVEDLVAWQARLNYIGDRMRVVTYTPTPFTDTFTPVGFTNLPIDVDAHRDVLLSSGIPPAPPEGSNTPQTARIGAIYNGALTVAVSPDTPQKAVHDETNQTYGTTGGGILASVTLQVVGNEEGQPSLFMNLDDGSPNGPGTDVDIFTGTGLQNIPVPVAQLGDGFHGEGVTCMPQDCAVSECPSDATPTPSPSPSPSPTPTDSDGDGWSDAAEAEIGTDPFDACPDNTTDDAWPPDINNDGIITFGDIGLLTSLFGQTVPPAPARRDIAPESPDGLISFGDIGRITALFGRGC